VVIGATYGGSLVFDYLFNLERLAGSSVWGESEVDQTSKDKAIPSGTT
jgi:hypothetical protein